MTTRLHRYAKSLQPGDRLVQSNNNGPVRIVTVLDITETEQVVTRVVLPRLIVTVQNDRGTRSTVRYSPCSTVELEPKED